MEKNRVFVIGLDGATFDVMMPMMARGKLPNIARLMREGTSGAMTSCIPDLSPPAWTSMVTGMHPGKHGILDFFGHVPRTYDTAFFNASFRTAEPVWSRLSEVGKKVCVINVPVTYPPDRVNGVMISGMDTPDSGCDFIHPPELGAELKEQMGGFAVESMRRDMSDKHIPEFIRNIAGLIRNRLETAEFLLSKEDWDFFMVVFESADRMQHEAWKYTEPSHPFYSRKSGGKYGALIEDTYEQLDEAVGRLCAKLPHGISLFVVSDHGFGPLFKGVRVENWLASRGWLSRAPRSVRFNLVRAKRLLARAIPSRLRRMCSAALRRPGGCETTKRPPMMLGHYDMTHTMAYPLGANGNIFINVQGRQPFGIVKPGADYEALRGEIIRGLEDLRDPDNGNRIVNKAFRREDVYSSFPEHAPDILIRWNPGYASMDETRVASSNRNRDPDIMTGLHCWSGTHRPNGILVMHGAHIREQGMLKDAQIMDVAPTVLALLSTDIPDSMDGRVLVEALDDVFLHSHPIAYCETKDETGIGDGAVKTGYSEDESKSISEKLRNLGYIG